MLFIGACPDAASRVRTGLSAVALTGFAASGAAAAIPHALLDEKSGPPLRPPFQFPNPSPKPNKPTRRFPHNARRHPSSPSSAVYSEPNFGLLTQGNAFSSKVKLRFKELISNISCGPDCRTPGSSGTFERTILENRRAANGKDISLSTVTQAKIEEIRSRAMICCCAIEELKRV